FHTQSSQVGSAAGRYFSYSANLHSDRAEICKAAQCESCNCFCLLTEVVRNRIFQKIRHVHVSKEFIDCHFLAHEFADGVRIGQRHAEKPGNRSEEETKQVLESKVRKVQSDRRSVHSHTAQSAPDETNNDIA